MASTAAAASPSPQQPPSPSPPSPFVLRMPAADDFHLHLRDDPLLADLVPHAAAQVTVVPPTNGNCEYAFYTDRYTHTMHFSDALSSDIFKFGNNVEALVSTT
jgi:hypothetical protein